MVFDGLHDIIKLDLGGPCPAMVDDGLPIGPVPAVHWREKRAASPPVHRPPPRKCTDGVRPARPAVSEISPYPHASSVTRMERPNSIITLRGHQHEDMCYLCGYGRIWVV